MHHLIKLHAIWKILRREDSAKTVRNCYQTADRDQNYIQERKSTSARPPPPPPTHQSPGNGILHISANSALIVLVSGSSCAVGQVELIRIISSKCTLTLPRPNLNLIFQIAKFEQFLIELVDSSSPFYRQFIPLLFMRRLFVVYTVPPVVKCYRVTTGCAGV